MNKVYLVCYFRGDSGERYKVVDRIFDNRDSADKYTKELDKRHEDLPKIAEQVDSLLNTLYDDNPEYKVLEKQQEIEIERLNICYKGQKRTSDEYFSKRDEINNWYYEHYKVLDDKIDQEIIKRLNIDEETLYDAKSYCIYEEYSGAFIEEWEVYN
jgi:hypothetical protein